MRVALTVLCAMWLATSAAAQAPQPPAGGRQGGQAVPARPAQPPSEVPVVMPVNVRVDIAIIDEGGPEPRRETVSMTTSDSEGASTRSNNATNVGDSVLNVDVVPRVSGLPAGKVRVRLTLDYWPTFGEDPRDQTRGSRTRVSSNTLLDDGKAMIVSDTSDPASNRRVRVEVTATILK